MTPLWTGEDVVAAVGSRGAEDWSASGISIDAATTKPGDLFVAIDGDATTAFANGAVAAIVTKIQEGIDQPQIIVADPQAALHDLARAARFRSNAKIVAVTGSVGKASTIGMLRVMFAGQGQCHAPTSRYNNTLDVPLCLATLPQGTDYAVVKIGARIAGDIAGLTRLVQPHAAIVTRVASEHLAAFGSDAAIAAEKSTIFEGLVPDEVGVFNGDDEHAAQLRKGISPARAVSFGGAGNDWVLRQVKQGPDVTVVIANGQCQDYLFKLGVLGQHFAMNALGALATATAVGIDPVVATLDLAQWRPSAGRGTRERIVLDPANDGETLELFDDAVNANPASVDTSLAMIAAVQPRDNVGRIVKGRRVAIFGDMSELGAHAQRMHRDLAQNDQLRLLDQIHCAGPHMYHLWRALPQHQQGQWVQRASDLVSQVSKLLDAGDVVLVKGSASSKISLIVDAIRKLGHRRP
jgi:UDP-N-acetylmuramoyl-tripeptide--D-alanyl-D-alanine ligase